MNHEVLSQVQLTVRSGSALFVACSVRMESYQQCYLSVHHALADEHTLRIVRRLVQLAHTGNLDLAL